MGKDSIAPPLSTAVTYILLALAERNLHGYGIMQETLRLSGGDYKIGPGTLYDNLKSIIAQGLVGEVEADPSGDEARRMYRLTNDGAAVLASELKRLEQLVNAGRRRLGAGPAREDVMSRGVVRAIYGGLLRLHPEPFRARFRDEMLQDFDDAAETYGSLWLMADAAVSLGRQRVFRSQQAVEIPAANAGLLSGVYLDTRPPHLTCSKLGLAVVLSLLSVFLFPPREPIQRHRAAASREVRHELRRP